MTALRPPLSRADQSERCLVLCRELSRCSDIEAGLARIVRAVADCAGAQRGLLVLYRGRRVTFGAAFPEGSSKEVLEASREIVREVLRFQRPARSGAAAGVPLTSQGRMVGAVYWDGGGEAHPDLLEFLSEIAASWIERRTADEPPGDAAASAIGMLGHLMEFIQDPQQLLEQALELVVRVAGAENGVVALASEAGEYQIIARRGTIDAPRVSRTISETALRETGAILISDAAVDARFKESRTVSDQSLKSVLVASIVVEKPLGVLYLENRSRAGSFTESHRKTVEAFARRLAPGLLHSLNYAGALARIERLRQSLAHNLEELGFRYSYEQIVGRSPAMMALLKSIDAAIGSDYPVIIEGETGTGKELVAKVIHFQSRRKDLPFIAENCGAISRTLIDSELFGHRKGAFTGALADRKGLFQIADGGTLFLDEIEEMPEEMQVKLLRVLETREIRPVGSDRPIRVDVRSIAASNRALEDLVQGKRFREDLFYRLDVFRLKVPPLRERREDIPLLTDHFLQKVAEECRQSRKSIDPRLLERFTQYGWPGNVRELENELRRLHATCPGDVIEAPGWKPMTTAPGAAPLSLARPLIEIERQAIAEALHAAGGNRSRAAQILGLSLRSLFYKIKQYGIS